MYKPTAKGYFTGAGGMEIGMLQAGIDVRQSLDLDLDAIECLKFNTKYFDHKVLYQDIKDIRVLNQEKTDVIIGTYPCAKYSTIADIHGTRTGDDLFLHFFRHIAIEQPEAYVVENVPGMKKFQVVMEAMTKLPGYYVNVICPVDALNWLPQTRKRLIIIGTKKPFLISTPQASNSRIRMKDIIERDPIYDMPDYILNRINGKYRDQPIIVDPDQPGSFAPTCVAHYAKDMGTRLVKCKNAEYGLRPFSVREYARLQGFPDDFYFPEKRSSYKLIGNAVPVHMGRWAGGELMKYFNRGQHDYSK
jgi:DNA (cytosine-5)-methyltransferase 1